MSTRLQKTEVISELDIFDLETDLETVIQRFTNCRNDNYQTIIVRIALEDDGDGPFGSVIVRGTREETDDEVNERKENEAKEELRKIVRQQEEIEKERRLFLELREKYKDLA